MVKNQPKYIKYIKITIMKHYQGILHEYSLPNKGKYFIKAICVVGKGKLPISNALQVFNFFN